MFSRKKKKKEIPVLILILISIFELLLRYKNLNQLLQLCTARIVFLILVTVLYTVMPEVCRWLTNEKQRKNAFRLTDQQLDVSSNG